MDATAGRIYVVCRAFVIAAAVAAGACDSHKGTFVVGGSVLQPSAVSFTSTSVLTQIDPQFLVRQPVISFGCPLTPPLFSTFRIVVREPAVDMFLGQVLLQFIDGSGVGGAMIPFPQASLNRLFGNTFIRARTFRSFPFTQGFGCFPSRPIMMTAQVTLVDGRGATQQSSVTASIQ